MKFNKIFITIFWTVFLISLISNLSYIYINYSDYKSIFLIFSLSATYSFIITLPSLFIKNRSFLYVFYVIVIFSLMILLILDYYLLFTFSKIINSDVIDIIFETNFNEIKNFFQAYISIKLVILVITITTALVYGCIKLSKLLSKYKTISFIGCFFILSGLLILFYSFFSFIKYKNGDNLPQYSSLTRSIYSTYIHNKRVKEIEHLAQISENYFENNKFETEKDLIICLVIGESHSYFHTPAYGYDKNTFPLMGKVNEEDGQGSVVWFNDIISIADHTLTAMESIFSLNKYQDFSSSVLFPVCFKSLGYKTSLYDNQYLINKNVSILNSKAISDVVFDYRNPIITSDDNLISQYDIQDDKELVIFHLNGSHYTYADRYPHDKFYIYDPSDYDNTISANKRKILAHYDNSLRFTDYVLYNLIDKLKNKSAVMVYLSDHGEEIFDQGDFLGHGAAHAQPSPNFQIRIPMFIWMSDGYKKDFPEKVLNIMSTSEKPGLSDDISHLLLDLSLKNNEIPGFNRKRSIINNDYEKPLRIVLNSINFDKIIEK